MRHRISILLALVVATFNIQAQASSANSQYLIKQLTQGGSESIRNASESIYRTHETDREVLDVLAETLLQRYPNAKDNYSGDAMAWACKGLAAAGDKRYYSVVKEVADKGDNRKMHKHCARAADDLGSAQGEQYILGMVSLSKAAETSATPASPAIAAEKPSSAPASTPSQQGQSYQPITEIKVGMSMQQAYDLAGPPTSTTTRQTGKAWVPFNFRGKDVVRTYALYKGQGRIVFSNSSIYSGKVNVLQVLTDPNESGYP